MAATPAPPIRAGSTRPPAGDVARYCRLYPQRTSIPVTDDARLVDALRLLRECLETWRRADLEGGSSRPAATPAISLGAFARGFAAWLDAHPERAGEPPEWLVGEFRRAGR